MFAYYKKGIAVLEILFVVVILVILLSVVMSQFNELRKKQALSAATVDIVSVLKKAQSDTLASIDSSPYGVHFETNAVIIFKGISYPSGTDETIEVASPAYISDINLMGGGSDVYFNRLTGIPNKTGTVTVSASDYAKTITIGATGIISVN